MFKRKGISFLIMLVSIITLTACIQKEPLDYLEWISDLADDYEGIPSSTTEDIELETTLISGDNVVTLTWESSHPEYLTNTGIVTRPPASVGDVRVYMTATFTYDEYDAVRTYSIVVIALDEVIYGVTFVSNGTNLGTINVTEGGLISEPSEPTGSAFFSFGGWFKDINFTQEWSFSEDTVTSNITLYAKWIESPKFTVTFDYDNGYENETLLVYQGSILPAQESPIKLGYTFIHWELTDGTVWNFSTDTVTEEITLTAIYEPMEYSINYIYPTVATLVTSGQLTYDIETPVSTLSVVTKTHADFIGWFDAPTGGNMVLGYPVGTTGDLTLYARFEDHIPYTITLVDPKGMNITQHKYLGEKADTVTNPDHLGYTFLGWFVNINDALPYDFSLSITSDITLTAKYQATAYDILYVGGVNIQGWPLYYTIESSTIILPSVQKEAYLFLGWYDAETGGNKVTEIASGSTGNKTYYARYEAISYTIEYQLDGGILGGTNPTTYSVETPTITLTNPTKEGFVFVGWFDAELEGNLITEIPLGSSGDIDLFARYSVVLSIDYYGYLELAVEDLKISNYYPETIIALANGEVYTKGNGEYGLIGNGSNESTEVWTNITRLFNLDDEDYIVEISLINHQAIARSLLGQVFVWGFISDDGIMIYTNVPIHVNGLVNPVISNISNIIPFEHGFLFETVDALYRYQNNLIEDITPMLGNGETLTWAPLFGMSNLPESFVFTTESSIYLYDPYTTKAFVNITSNLNLPGEDIRIVLSQDMAVHVILETVYVYGMFTGDEQNPFILMQVPLNMTLNEGEFILKTFAGGGLFTNQYRLLLPEYIMDEMTEAPIQVNYVDITPDITLNENETITDVHSPFFIETSTGRMLLITTDGEDENSTLQVFDIELDTLLLPGEEFVEFRMAGWEVFFVSNLRFAALEFGQTGILLEALTIQTIGVIHQQEIASYLFEDNTYIPDNPLYQSFNGWYMDSELTIPFTYDLVSPEMTLYASFIYTHYFITIELYDGNTPEVIAIPFDEIPVEPVVPSKPHQEFTGWYYYDNQMIYDYDFSYAINKDVLIYASYVSAQYDVTYIFEGFDPIVTSEYAMTFYGDLEIEVPAGYEIIAVYMDADMLIPFNPDLQLEGPLTLWVAIDPMTIDVYYYHDTEDITFVQLYAINYQNFGITADHRIYVWGDNYQGGLGIGMDHILDVPTPLDITHLFNLGLNEFIVSIDGLYSYKIALTSEGRVFVWGYYNQNGSTQSIVKEITHMLNIPLNENINGYYLANTGIYFYLSDGTIKYFEYYQELVKTTTTSIMLDVVYSEQVLYDPNKLFLVTVHGAYIVEFVNDNAPAQVIDLSSSLNGDQVFSTRLNYQAYAQLYLYTIQGRVYLFDAVNLTITLVDDLELNPMEQLVNMFYIQSDILGFTTSDNRFLTYLNMTVTDVDTTILLPDEMILSFEFGMYFFTSAGRSIQLDYYNHTFVSPIQEYIVTESDFVYRYIMIGWVLYAELFSGSYVQTAGTELTKTVGANLMIEQYAFGTPFVLADITPKPGYTFHAWVDIYGNLYLDTPTNTVFLYPYFTTIE